MEVVRAFAQNLIVNLRPFRRFARSRHITGLDGDVGGAEKLVDFYAERSPIEGRAILELGPGKTLDVLEIARSRGARKCVAVDITPYHTAEEASTRGLEYRIYDGTHLPFEEDSFDLIWACWCLQHVRHPEITVDEMRRVLRPGGRLVCRVDLRDHYHMYVRGRQYDCLKHSPAVWRMMAWNRASYVNRLRFSEWQDLLASKGFRPILVEPHEDQEHLRQNRHHEYLKRFSDQDLATFVFDGAYEI